MNYPENLKLGDTIGICAPSGGIVGEKKIKRLEEAIKQLKEMGYKVIETSHVKTEEKGRSTDAKTRAEEFMELYENPEVKLIIFAAGGDFLVEIFDFLDFEKIKLLPPKWIQGYSDITGIEYLFNTILDIPSMYHQTIKDYAMKPLHKSLLDALKIESGLNIVQESFDFHEKPWDFTENKDDEELNSNVGYNLTEEVEWKNLLGEENIQIEGRAIGGCLDCIKVFIGTKYDKVKQYIKRHPEGIIWFLEVFEMSTPALYLTLWQMKNAGYFENCNGIIFGRSLFIREDYEISFEETLKDALEDLNIPIIYDADIGHVSPQLAIVNGGYLKIISEKGKGVVNTQFK